MSQEEKSSSNNNSSEPWLNWAFEMPKTTSKFDSGPDFELLNSKEHLRKMMKEVRQQLFDIISKSSSPMEHIKNGCIILSGGKQSTFELYDTDTLHCNFRQEPYFRYLFGLNEPDAMGIIDLEKKQFILLVTPMPKESERWLGNLRSFEYYKKEYGVDEVDAVKCIDDVLQNRNLKYLYLLDGVNTDSNLRTKTLVNFSGMNKYWTNSTDLYPILSECRVIKTPSEIKLLESACRVTSKAHVYVMRHIKQGMMERQLEALFKGYSYYYGGSRHQAYECICGSGVNGSILHYGHSGYPNDRIITNKDVVVLDMGSEYMGYATDITCSYPVSGKFTDDQKLIHTAVYEAQQAVFNSMKEGVDWKMMHRLAERVIIKHLLKIGILKCNEYKNSVEKSIQLLMREHLASMFMPHGLGHLIGINVHDVGGFNFCNRSKELGLCWLRTTRILKAGMIITVEPGCYFNKSWINQMKDKYPKMKKYINDNILKRFLNYGGCRLEDDVLVTKNGIKNLTLCPRSVEQIEKVMSQAQNC